MTLQYDKANGNQSLLCILLSDRAKWSDFYQYKDKGYKNTQGVPKTTDRHILPTMMVLVLRY